MNVISVAVLVAGSYALSERKYLFAIAVVLSAITIAGTGLVLAFQQPWALLVSSSSIVVSCRLFLRNYSFLCAGKRPGYFR
jgi:hypothetical protein